MVPVLGTGSVAFRVPLVGPVRKVSRLRSAESEENELWDK